MAKTARNMKQSFITLNPSLFTHLLSLSPFSSPKKNSKIRNICAPNLSLLFFLCLFVLCTFLLICILIFTPILHDPVPCSALSPQISPHTLASLSTIIKGYSNNQEKEPSLSSSVMLPLPLHRISGNVSYEEAEFWKQPDGEGYRPCLDFSLDYRKKSRKIFKEKRKYLVVVVSGGLNQQRNQIVDAVVIARILEAVLVFPVLQVNRIWGDESEFSDIFDMEHFKKTLQADVRIVSSLPSNHLVSKQFVVNLQPVHVSPAWLRSRLLHILNEEGFLVLKGLDSRLSRNLSPDLQKLRCKVAFHALRFSTHVRELGSQIARRMWIEGPYIAIHLRLEKDVWVRTGCSTGLGSEYDDVISRERESHPDFLTDKLNMTSSARRLAGLCPLNAREMAKLLQGLGVPKDARIYVAGGEPFGGDHAIRPLVEQFPNIVTKHLLAREGELGPYVNRPSVLAAIDYMVCLSSNVFMASHGGNMGRAIQGHRAYVGHRKSIKPNKRMMLNLFEEASISEEEFGRLMRKLHGNYKGQPELRSQKMDRDVLAYPVPECMCKY